MQEIIDLLSYHLDYAILLFVRVSALTVSSPIFGRRNVPNQAKIGLCLAISVLMLGAVPPISVVYTGVIDFATLVIIEAMFGVAMGWVTTAMFQITFTAGQIIDMQMGFGMANLLDAQSNIQVPVMGNVLNIVLLIVFFMVDGHLKLVSIVASTVITLPVGSLKAVSTDVAIVAIEVFVLSFILAINVAMPVIVSGMLGEVALGFIVRTVPQMNIFVVGIPIKIIMGFLMLFLMMPVFIYFSEVIFDNMFSGIEVMFKGLAGL